MESGCRRDDRDNVFCLNCWSIREKRHQEGQHRTEARENAEHTQHLTDTDSITFSDTDLLFCEACENRFSVEHLRDHAGRVLCIDCLGRLLARASRRRSSDPSGSPGLGNWRVRCRRVKGKGQSEMTLVLAGRDEAAVAGRLRQEYPSWELILIEPAPPVGLVGLRVLACVAGVLLGLFGAVDWVASLVGKDLTGSRKSPAAFVVAGGALFALGAAGTELGNPSIPDSEK